MEKYYYLRHDQKHGLWTTSFLCMQHKYWDQNVGEFAGCFRAGGGHLLIGGCF